MTVEQMLDSMSAEEYLDWQAFLHAESERAAHRAKKQKKGMR